MRHIQYGSTGIEEENNRMIEQTKANIKKMAEGCFLTEDVALEKMIIVELENNIQLLKTLRNYNELYQSSKNIKNR